MKLRISRWAVWFGLALLPACDGGNGTTNGGKVCEPGTEVFCRPCEGNPNEPGTRTCNADGTGFDACVPRSGECAVVGCTPGESLFCVCDNGDQGEKICNAEGTGYSVCACSAGAGGGGTGGSGAGGGGPSGTKSLFSPCFSGDECESGLCPMGYCTKACAAIDDCPFGVAECVSAFGDSICLPICTTQSDCDVYGPPSECGYTKAVDDFPVTTCADWVEDLELPPEGTECASDTDCNLGHEGKERVCAFQTCTAGCYAASDCPVTKDCSSSGDVLGSCN